MLKSLYSWIFTLLFIAFAAVQYNDPDPYIWIPVYLIFAALSISILYFPLQRKYYLNAAGGALVFAILQRPAHWEGIGENMLTENMEKARESLGLLICAFSAILNYFFIPKTTE
jgi:hypothetical protein